MRCLSVALRFATTGPGSHRLEKLGIFPKSPTWNLSSLNKSHVVSQFHKLHGDQNDLKYSTDDGLRLALQKKQTVPVAPPPKCDEVAALYQFLQSRHRLAVITGAGISTESGIPDYRSPNGAYSAGFKPITHQEFLRSEKSQKRYWARSYVGWRKFIAAEPGETHTALARLESRGYINNIITQNVDRLHQKAGSSALELHGTTHEVICLSCKSVTSRHEFQVRVKEMNPEWASALEALELGIEVSTAGMQQRPDGDIEIDERFWEGRFQIPKCESCSGVLKPNVVLFGDNLPKVRAETALDIINKADSILVLGSSLMVLSAFRLAKAAYDAKKPLAIINVGATRADDLALLKIECRTGEILSRLLHHGCLNLPAP